MIEWVGAVDVGLRFLDFVERRGAPLQSDTFVEFYSEAVKSAIDVLPKVETLDNEGLANGLGDVLDLIACTVHAYHKRKHDVAIVANYMVPETPSDELVQQSRFCQRTRRADSYHRFLRLYRWTATDARLPSDVVLPVELPPLHGKSLPGAPRAFLSRNLEVVADTTDYTWWHDCCVDDDIREEMTTYFRQYKDILRSFVAFPVLAPMAQPGADPIAIVNVQSNQPYIFGRFPGNWRKLALLMQPFLAVSAYHIERLHTLDAGN